MRTICILMDANDKKWLVKYLRQNSADEEINIVAPSFEGRFVAESLRLPYKTYEKEAWSLAKKNIYPQARKMAYQWYQLPDTKEDSCLEPLRYFNDYPLLTMHQGSLLVTLNEIIMAYEFVKRVIEIEKPNKIVVGDSGNPFKKELISLITCSGLEKRAAKALSLNKGIEFKEEPAVKAKNWKSEMLRKIIKGLKNPKLAVSIGVAGLRHFKRKALRELNLLKSPSPLQFKRKSEETGPKILFIAWGGYYLKQISATFDLLLEQKASIVLVINGWSLTSKEERYFRQKGIQVFHRSDWQIKNEQGILNEWKEKGIKAFSNIASSEELKSYFSDSYGSYFVGLVDEAIKRELVENLPKTVIELIRSENILQAFNPDLVVVHFAWYPLESCDVLPARVSGIPTLSLTHGIPGYTGSERDTVATQYYAVEGDAYRNALMQAVRFPGDAVFAIGQSRLEKIDCRTSSRDSKKDFGFNPDKPLCIFCDGSVFIQEVNYRHSTFKTIEQILDLKRHVPDLQMIFRVHHGPDYNEMQRYFEKLNIPGLIFQISPSPLFTEIVKAADFVISNHTSAITEALLSGIRVIYLCALSDLEPLYLNSEMIKVADKFELLPEMVKSIIEGPMSKEDVRAMAQPYFDRVLCGNDGKATERLAQLMLRLAQKPKDERKKGFQDWIDRIEASCDFKSGSWDIDNIFKRQV